MLMLKAIDHDRKLFNKKCRNEKQVANLDLELWPHIKRGHHLDSLSWLCLLEFLPYIQLLSIPRQLLDQLLRTLSKGDRHHKPSRSSPPFDCLLEKTMLRKHPLSLTRNNLPQLCWNPITQFSSRREFLCSYNRLLCVSNRIMNPGILRSLGRYCSRSIDQEILINF